MRCTTITPLIYGGKLNPAGVEIEIADDAQARRLLAKGIVADPDAFVSVDDVTLSVVSEPIGDLEMESTLVKSGPLGLGRGSRQKRP